MVGQTWRVRLLASLRTVFWIGASTGVVMGGIYAVTRAREIPFTTLTRDATATLDAPWYVGAVSNGLILVAVAGAAVALFTWWSTRGAGVGQLSRLLAWMGLGMIVFGLDDLYLIHEEIFPTYFGIRSEVVFAVYGLAVAILLLRFGRMIVDSTNFGLLLFAGLFMALSLVIDLIAPSDLFDLPFSTVLVEDPAKIMGVILVTAYLVGTSRIAMRMMTTTAKATPS